MKLVMNICLWIAQWILIRSGGQVALNKKELTLYAPQGKHWFVDKSKLTGEVKS